MTDRKAIAESYAKQASTREAPASAQLFRGHIDNDQLNLSSTLPIAREMLPTSIDKCPAACQTAQCVSIPSEIFHEEHGIKQYIIVVAVQPTTAFTTVVSSTHHAWAQV